MYTVNINVISGLICVGKSTLLQRLKREPQFQDACFIELDKVGIRHWGHARKLTKTEKIYRNQLAREEVQTQIIVQGKRTVFLEMVMLTHGYHQEPFVRMAEETRFYLRKILLEQAEMLGEPPQESANAQVKLNVVLLHCSLATVKKRLKKRNAERSSNSPVTSLEGVLDTAIQFEMPTSYVPLPIETDNESRGANEKRYREILAFFTNSTWPRNISLANRLKAAKKHLEEQQRAARAVGITEGMPFVAQDRQRIN